MFFLIAFFAVIWVRTVGLTVLVRRSSGKRNSALYSVMAELFVSRGAAGNKGVWCRQ